MERPATPTTPTADVVFELTPPCHQRPLPPSSLGSLLGTRPSPCGSDREEEQPAVLNKRRRMNMDLPSYTPSLSSGMSSPSGCPSPMNLSGLAEQSFEELGLLNLATHRLRVQSWDTDHLTTDSNRSSPAVTSPAVQRHDFRGRLRKHELWPAIRTDYHYLMDKEIIETCKVSRKGGLHDCCMYLCLNQERTFTYKHDRGILI